MVDTTHTGMVSSPSPDSLGTRMRGDDARGPEALVSGAVPRGEPNAEIDVVLSALPIAVVTLDRDLKVSSFKCGTLDSGPETRGCVGLPMGELTWWRDDGVRRAIAESHARQALSGQAQSFEGSHMAHSGRLATLRFYMAPLPDMQGVGLMAQDMSDWAEEREQRQAIVSEQAHRTKNMLTLVSSIVNLNLRQATSLEAAREGIGDRLSAFSRSQDLVFSKGLRAADIMDIVAYALEPFHGETLHLDLDPVKIPARMAVTLNLALHELATNAVKYGAWSREGGRVTLSARCTPETDGERTRLDLRWLERDGPTLTAPPSHRGFGTTLTHRILSAQFSGDVEADYGPSGLDWRMSGFIPPARADFVIDTPA